MAILIEIASYKTVGQGVENILIFGPYFNLFVSASIVFTKLVYLSAGLLAYQKNWPASKLIIMNTLVVSNRNF